MFCRYGQVFHTLHRGPPAAERSRGEGSSRQPDVGTDCILNGQAQGMHHIYLQNRFQPGAQDFGSGARVKHRMKRLLAKSKTRQLIYL